MVVATESAEGIVSSSAALSRTSFCHSGVGSLSCVREEIGQD